MNKQMNPRIVFVGESEGRNEAVIGHPLVWWTGYQLAQMLFEIDLAYKPPRYPAGVSSDSPTARRFQESMVNYWKGLQSSHNLFVTNVFNAHPEGDKTELFFTSTADGVQDLPSMRIKNRVFRLNPEYRYHVDKLYSDLALLRPNVVVALGNFACWALLSQSGINKLRGTIQWSTKTNLKCIATFHPAALRDETLRPTIVADLKKAKRESAFPEIRRIKRWIICENPRTNERATIDQIAAWFQQPAESYSIDIETGTILFNKTELKAMSPRMRGILNELISMVGFATDPYNSVVIPFMDKNDSGLNYWKSVQEEAKAWKILIAALDSPVPKTFQNGIFDIGHFIRNRIRVRNATDDTMILQHSLYIELPKALGYMSSIHSDEIAHKQMRHSEASLKREE